MEVEDGPKSAVIFKSISEAYTPGSNIPCIFSINSEYHGKINEKCWVGLFRVGWERIDQCISRTFLSEEIFKEKIKARKVDRPLSAESDSIALEIALDFSSIEQPSDVEFYQFCFITADGAVLGASCPFSITNQISPSDNVESTGSSTESTVKTSGNEELEWCPWLDVSEEEDDALLVHNKTTLLEKSLANVVGENSVLRESVAEKDLEIEKLRSELEDMRERESMHAAAILHHKKQQDDGLKWIEELQEMNGKIEEDRNALKEQIRCMTVANANLEEQKSDLRRDMDLLSKDLQLARGKELQKVCKGYEDRLAESAKAIRDLESAYRESKEYIEEMKIKHKEELNNMSKSFDDVITKLNAQCSDFENAEIRKRELLDEIEHITHSFMKEKRDLNDQIDYLEKEIEHMRTRDSSEHNQLKRDLHSFQVTVAEMEANIEKLEAALDKKCDELAKVREAHFNFLRKHNTEFQKCEMELRHVSSELDAVKGENNLLKEKCNGHSGARHALQVAYKHTQKQLSSLKDDHETLSQKYQSLSHESTNGGREETVKELKNTVEDLKIRLCIGARVYREKALQCKLLQKELRMYNDASDLRPEAEPKMLQKASPFKTKQPPNEVTSTELNVIIGRLKEEVEVKERIIADMQIKLKSSEDAFKKSVQGMTAELVSLKKDLQAKDSEIQFLLPSRVDDSEKALEEPKAFEDTSERQTAPVPTTVPSEAAPQCSESGRRIFYPPTYDRDVSGSSAQKGATHCVPLARGIVPPSSSCNKEVPVEFHSHATLSSPEHARGPKISRGQVDVRLTKAIELCPVCNVRFPSDTSEVAATNHVNRHFDTGEH